MGSATRPGDEDFDNAINLYTQDFKFESHEKNTSGHDLALQRLRKQWKQAEHAP